MRRRCAAFSAGHLKTGKGCHEQGTHRQWQRTRFRGPASPDLWDGRRPGRLVRGERLGALRSWRLCRPVTDLRDRIAADGRGAAVDVVRNLAETPDAL